ncbi:MAG: DEAD/DEAH box helicase [Flavobacteriales bacterium]
MNVFETHGRIVGDYASYIRSFLNIADKAISDVVEQELDRGKLWPDPLLQFNPAYEMAGSVEALAARKLLHPDIPKIFKGYSLYKHQQEAIELGVNGKDFVVTSGTGSGKSLTYIGTIFHHLLTNPVAKGGTAVIVYPMNALINSQEEEFKRYKKNYEDETGKPFPITFGKYTGQEKEEERKGMREAPPQVLLTNYMMLELLLTRIKERGIRDAIYANLKYLVFDELHTFRGRQGADVAMLIRRIQAQCAHRFNCAGTSATMVSVGSDADRKQQVASVASTLFGRAFHPAQVINETLQRSLDHSKGLPSKEELATGMAKGIGGPTDAEALKKHPVAIWLEAEAALEEKDGLLTRRKPKRLGEVIDDLHAASGVDREACKQFLAALLEWISAVNIHLRSNGQRYTILPFKLHQFISQTGAVYTTLDRDENRYITLEPGFYKQDDPDKKPIYQNVFSRASGHPFICVTWNGDKLEPREFRDSSTDDDDDDHTMDGYLIVGEEVWDPRTDVDFLPDSWLRQTKEGKVPRTEKKDQFPILLHFDEYGNCSTTDKLKWWGWFMRKPLLFDPTSGAFYDSKTNEGTKLTKLGSEGRSTSTTITAFSILNQLDGAGYSRKDQKLLSFTDNRQDAALQAGHFNDFVQVVQLRAGIHKALRDAKDNQLSYTDLGNAVFQALGLPMLDFANTNVEPPLVTLRRRYEDAFKDFLFYRAVADLRRSWRIVLPNLEQCALLEIAYRDLSEIAAESAFWKDLVILNELEPEERAWFIGVVLDYYRLEYAIESRNYLAHDKIKENEKLFRELLRAPWTLDKSEQIREPFSIRLDPLQRQRDSQTKSMGASSALGKFIKLFVRNKKLKVDLRGDNYREFILALMDKLAQAQYLHVDLARSVDNEEVPIYRLRIDTILWRLGDGENAKPEIIKRRSYKDQKARPNIFFRDLYKRDLSQRKRLRGEDHTGQLGTDLRIEREEKFREGEISALFCSPTMELGIDIGGLSVVHMRNAPPNPANYAQRSGRAGRSGQGALVFTYCSSYSPHDRHYFNEQKELVAGVVQAPRLDLLNKELLTAHLNALAISEIGLPGLEGTEESKPSLMNFVDEDQEGMPLLSEVRSGLAIQPKKFADLKAAFTRVIADIKPQLAQKADTWYNDQWVERTLNDIANSLDGSLNRWRKLFKASRLLLNKATIKLDSGILEPDEYKKQKRNVDHATRQLNLLRNNTGRRSTELSEFYPYRYLAAEGFLPGYNFTRLPIRIYLPTSDATGEFISRPRSIALREFGPMNQIYYGGRKYRVAQVVVQDTDAALSEAKVSTKAGYFLDSTQMHLELCPFTGANLSDNANRENLHHLLEMAESRAEEVDRISCEEEERISRGYEINTYFTVDGGQMDRVKKAKVRSDVNTMLNMEYIPAARLIHVNKKWRANSAEGFPLGMTTGDWRASMPAPDAGLKQDYQRVKLWTSNLADALYIEPVQPLGLNSEGVVTLQYAIKRAIENTFQVESNEIGVVAIGDPKAPNILIYEAAEGSLGILSQFVENIDVYHKVVDEAIALCRYDEAGYKGPASYDDLLSYYNQRDHKIIDRHLIKDALQKLKACTIEIQANQQFADYEAHYKAMLRGKDPTSSTEAKFLKYLYDNGLRLPDAAQKTVDGLYIQPDFYYEPRIWVFCDGTPHDDPKVQADDKLKRQAIKAKGDEVLVYYYKDDLAMLTTERNDIFKKVR